MERITIFNRTTKSEGQIRLRFRLTDGRKADMYHKSEIKASLDELAKFDTDGQVKAGTRIFNKVLAAAIREEIEIMRQAYHLMIEEGRVINGEGFEETIQAIKNPTRQESDQSLLLPRLERFIECGVRDGIFGPSRENQYRTLYDIVSRYLIINGDPKMKAAAVDADMLMRLRQFMANEWQYLERWSHLYEGIRPQNLPTAPRNENTIAIKMKQLQSFFNELEDNEEIEKSPFRKLGKERRHNIMREQYDAPIYLYAQDLETLRTRTIPDNLKDVRDAFIVQCALGCRIGDFKRLKMEDIAVSEEGIPFVHYIPEKTKSKLGTEEIETPLVRFAFDIIKERGGDFPILRNVTGAYGYNAKIKDLLQFCKIERPCAVFNAETGKNEYHPLWQEASSKLARKTHVDMMSKVQVNLYAAGLHKAGSKAVNHYTALELKDRFVLMCTAFDQEPYKVDKDLNIL